MPGLICLMLASLVTGRTRWACLWLVLGRVGASGRRDPHRDRGGADPVPELARPGHAAVAPHADPHDLGCRGDERGRHAVDQAAVHAVPEARAGVHREPAVLAPERLAARRARAPVRRGTARSSTIRSSRRACSRRSVETPATCSAGSPRCRGSCSASSRFEQVKATFSAYGIGPFLIAMFLVLPVRPPTSRPRPGGCAPVHSKRCVRARVRGLDARDVPGGAHRDKARGRRPAARPPERSRRNPHVCRSAPRAPRKVRRVQVDHAVATLAMEYLDPSAAWRGVGTDVDHDRVSPRVAPRDPDVPGADHEPVQGLRADPAYRDRRVHA